MSIASQVKSDQARSGQVRSGQVRSGQVRSGQVRSGQVRSGQVRSGNATSIAVWPLGHQDVLLHCSLSAAIRTQAPTNSYGMVSQFSEIHIRIPGRQQNCDDKWQ